MHRSPKARKTHKDLSPKYRSPGNADGPQVPRIRQNHSLLPNPLSNLLLNPSPPNGKP